LKEFLRQNYDAGKNTANAYGALGQPVSQEHIAQKIADER
jgi:hypothetical protein